MKDITKPTLLLDKAKCLRNIERMADKASRSGLSFRPHFKTHQSAGIGQWFRDFGVDRITVSSMDMAYYFAENGWSDILIAFPFQPLETQRLNQLADKVSMSIIADHPDALAASGKLTGRISVYIDLDPDYGRTGVSARDTGLMDAMLKIIDASSMTNFAGFYCHAGHSYKTTTREEKDALHQQTLNHLHRLKSHYSERNPRVLFGDTPNCSVQEDFSGIDELTPGNFVFFDLIQASLGSCTESDIAVAMACPVAARYPDRNQVLVHGGAVHFSKESMQIGADNVFGKTVQMDAAGWSPAKQSLYLSAMSQEHGIIQTDEAGMNACGVGDLLYILPVHSCLTANLFNAYLCLDGKVIPRFQSNS